MKVQVEMTAFEGNGIFREVTIPDEESNKTGDDLLEAVFKYGQNDFQFGGGRISVSTADVIHLNGEKWLILGIGFKKLTDEEYRQYRETPIRDRSFACMMMSRPDKIEGQSPEG